MSSKKELEEREIILEGIVDAYQKLIDDFIENFPIQTTTIHRLDNVSRALFNAAQIRDNIEDLVDFSVKYEEE